MRALSRASGKDVDAGLDSAADKLVAMALDGERWAIEEMGNRIEGKPAQAVTVSGDEDQPLTIKSLVELVRPGDGSAGS